MSFTSKPNAYLPIHSLRAPSTRNKYCFPTVLKLSTNTYSL